MKPQYTLLFILNLIVLVINKNHILASSLISGIWGKFFIKNNFVLLLLILTTLFINTTATYIIKYNYHDKRVQNKTPKYIYFLSILISIAIYNLSENKQMVNQNIDLIKIGCFILIFYIIGSLLEHYVHKYVMHCDLNGHLNKLLKKSFLTKATFSDLCEHHIKHHKEVKPNMKLSGDELDGSNGLFMTWDVSLNLIIIISIVLFPINKFFNFNFKKLNILALIIIASILWCYLWNKTHPQMHDSLERINIVDGPVENIYNLRNVTNFLLDNHKNHHLQKGEKKGNFNVILLGADEWLNQNNTDIDNTEYCKTHKSEHVCK
jgi:hypothetical protein